MVSEYVEQMPTCVWICLKLIRAFFTRFYYKTKTLAMTSYGKAEKYQACQRTYINWQKPARLRPLGSRGKKCKPLERGGKETEKPVHLPHHRGLLTTTTPPLNPGQANEHSAVVFQQICRRNALPATSFSFLWIIFPSSRVWGFLVL